MRPLSRLLSVFIALILMGVSLGTVSAAATAPGGKSVVRVTVERTDDLESVHPNDTLKYKVTVERIDNGHLISGGAIDGPDADTTADEDADGTSLKNIVLDDTNAFKEYNVEYVVQLTDLGTAASRDRTLTWTFTFSATHADAAVAQHDKLTSTGTDVVTVTARGALDEGASQVTLDTSASTYPMGDDIAKGAKVTFKLTVTTGKYGLGNPDADLAALEPTDGTTLVIRKQLFNADDEAQTDPIPVANFAIPRLPPNSTSKGLESTEKTVSLLTREADMIQAGGRLEFSYDHAITEARLFEEGKNTAVNLDGDATTATYEVDKLKMVFITVAMPVVEEEVADPSEIGSNSAAVVTLGEDGNTIHVTPTDGTPEFTLFVGTLFTDGSARYTNGGYIRQDRDPQGRGYGQTYGILKRDLDGAIVRKWISSTDPVVTSGGIPWDIVEAQYTYARDIISAIPLDHLYPTPDQLVRNDDNHKIYVYRSGAWRHIPDLATFKYHQFYWCDVTSADADFFNRFTEGTPLVPSGAPDIPNYPNCHNE